MAEKQRSEKQKQNDIACSVRLKACHAEMKRLKEMKTQEETQEEIKKEKKPRKPRARKEKYDRIPKLITPLENQPDDYEISI